MPELLSDRALNRATLARQWLLSRQDTSALHALEHLIGLQAQAPMPPYYGLWCRLEHFRADELSTLLLERQAVRLVLMRGTVHVVAAQDALPLRTLVQPLMDRDLRRNTTYSALVAEGDLSELTATGQDLLGQQALTLPELRSKLAELYPERQPNALSQALRSLLPLVQVPPRGVWGQSGQPKLMTAEGWLGQPLAAPLTLDDLARRYLRAFGPASPADMGQWCGLTRLGEVFEHLRPQLVTFRDTGGTELFDLPDAPRPSQDTPAPVRLLPAFDNLLLSHAKRRRVMSEEAQNRVFAVKNGVFPHTILIDGFVAGTWRIELGRKDAKLTLELFQPATKDTKDQLGAEAHRLLKLAATADAHEVHFAG